MNIRISSNANAFDVAGVFEDHAGQEPIDDATNVAAHPRSVQRLVKSGVGGVGSR